MATASSNDALIRESTETGAKAASGATMAASCALTMDGSPPKAAHFARGQATPGTTVESPVMTQTSGAKSASAEALPSSVASHGQPGAHRIGYPPPQCDSARVGLFSRLIAAPFQALKRIIYPPLCLACDADLDADCSGFCAACTNEMVSVGLVCPFCAATVGPFTDTTKGCPDCRRSGYRFDAAYRVGIYEDKLRELCLKFKSIHNALLGPALARLLDDRQGDALRRERADMVVAVPLHFMRRFRRGFNQADSIARKLAEILKASHLSRLLKRVRRTRPQAELNRSERRENVRNAFRARPSAKLKGATVLLVDDILTTGATCFEAARALKAGGAKRVVVAVIARAHETVSK